MFVKLCQDFFLLICGLIKLKTYKVLYSATVTYPFLQILGIIATATTTAIIASCYFENLLGTNQIIAALAMLGFKNRNLTSHSMVKTSVIIAEFLKTS